MESKKCSNITNQNYKKEEIKEFKSFTNSKTEALFQHKYSVENLLKMIKNFQYDYISDKAKNCDIKTLKQVLVLLKENLSFILNKKNRIYNEKKEENVKNKESMMKKIYFRNNETAKKKIDYISEKEQLKILNFRIENDIDNADFLIREKTKLIEKEYNGMPKKHNSICDSDNKELSLEIMNNHKTEINKKLINLTVKRTEQEDKIENILKDISQIKNKISKKKIDNIKDKFNSPIHNNYEKKSQNFNSIIIPKQLKENICYKYISELNVDFSNKETNDTNSIKNNNDLNFIKLCMEHSNYNYLKNRIFDDVDNSEPLKSFDSSLDSEF